MVTFLLLWLTTNSIADLPHVQQKDVHYGATCIIASGFGNLLETRTVNGEVVRSFDRNHDGERDAETYSELIGGPNRERPFPYKFLIDDDFDGIPDRKFIDFSGDGRCEDIKQIPMERGKLS